MINITEEQLLQATDLELAELKWATSWLATARKKQLPPAGDWTMWGVLAGRGFGKLLDKNTPVPTPTGWSTMGDLVVGDEVFDEAGVPCKVTGIYEPQVTQAYRLTFSDGATLDADADHQWVTWTHAERKAFLRSPYEETWRFPHNWPQWKLRRVIGTSLVRTPKVYENSPGPQIRTTQEIVDTLTYGKREDTNHCIPCAAPLQLPDADLPIPPYTLGAWLGDGCSHHGLITAHQDDAVHTRSFIEADGFQTTSHKNLQNFGILGLKPLLRGACLLLDKHVPSIYLRGSVSQRLALLQGLMDSDGNIENSNTVAFVNTNKRIIDAVVEIVHSLGMKTTVRSRIGKLNGIPHKRYWRVQFTPTINPFRLPRKAARITLGGKQSLRNHHRMIVSANPIDPMPMRCISVDSPNRMYLVGREMIPTHNTLLGAQWLARCAYQDQKALPRAVIAPTFNDVRHTCFEGPAGILKVVPHELIADYNKTNLMITLVNGATIRGFSAEEPERLRGPQHADIWCTPGDTLVHMGDGSQRRVDSIRAGEFVLTRQGPRRVLISGESGNPNPQVRIMYGASGLTLTEDHPILTNRGWLPAGQVREGDVLCAINALNGAESVGTPMEVATTSAPTKAFGLSARFGCTDKSGSTTTDRSRTAAMSITLTTTSSTTTLRTFASWLAATIAATISTAARLLTPSVLLPAIRCAVSGTQLNTERLLAQHAERSSAQGRRALRVDFAAASALNGGGWAHSAPCSGTATCAATSMSRSGGQVGFARGPAVLNMLRNILQNAGLALASAVTRYSSRPVPEFASAGKPALMPLAVKGVERLPTRERVYCLKVEDDPEYFANGVLIHNCDELAAWQYDTDTWDMAMMGLRLGDHPRILWTTTPKPKELVRRLVNTKGAIITRGSTFENKANLPKTFFDQLAQYEGTQIGRQELEGELISPEESGIIKRSWLRLWPAKKPLPNLEWIVMSMDTAFTEATMDRKTNSADYTACTTWGVFRHDDRMNVLLLDAWQDQLGMPDLIKRVKKELNTAYGDDQDSALIKPMFGSAKPLTSGRKPDILIIEDKGSGISLRQMLEREGVQAYAYNPGRADKLARLHMVSSVFARKQVWMPESLKRSGSPMTWCEDMLEQLCSFTGPGSIKHDDYVDSVTQAIRLLMDKNLLTAVKESKLAYDPPPKRQTVNPYAA